MAGLIPSSEMTALQTVAASALDQTCQIQRRGTYTSDGAGGNSATYANHGAAVAAGMAKPSAAVLQLYAERIGSQESWTVRLPFGTDVLAGDHLIIGAYTLMVQADLSLSSYTTVQQVLATRIS